MDIKTIPLSSLEANLAETLNECAETGQTVVVELADHRLLAIQPFDAAGDSDDDSLVDDLIETNPEFRALLEKSKAGPTKPFPFDS